MDDYGKIDWNEGRRNFYEKRGLIQNKPKSSPKIDEEVSKVVGKPIYINDFRLIKAVAEMKQMNKRGDDPRYASQDNYLKDPSAIEYLKKKLA